MRRTGVIAVATVLAAATLAAAGPARAADPPYGTASDDTPAPCAAGTVDCPNADAFYTPPADLASLTPGTLIGSRAATIAQPGPEAGSATTISYASEDAFGKPVLGIATVLLPSTPYVGTGGRPLVSFQFAEDSLGRQCAPSYGLQHQGANAIISAEAPDVEGLLAQGYAVVVPDAEGPAEQFIVGQQEGHAVLDGVRAAEHLATAGLSTGTRVALMGYSGGAHATAWASELAASYAPDVNLVGVVEGGTPADLTATAAANEGTVSFGLVLFAALGFERGFPAAGIHDELNAAGLAAEQAAGDQCVNAVFDYPLKTLDDYTKTPDFIDSPALQAILAHDKLGQAPPHVPVFNYHATTDEIVPYAQDLTLVQEYCAAGVAVDHVTFPADHVSGEAAGVPVAMAWLAGRFDGAPVTNTCAVTGSASPPAALDETPWLPALALAGLGAAAYATRRRFRIVNHSD